MIRMVFVGLHVVYELNNREKIITIIMIIKNKRKKVFEIQLLLLYRFLVFLHF